MKEKKTALSRLLFRQRTTTQDNKYDSGLALDEVIGNLTISRSGSIIAWYVAEPQRWNFRTDSDRNWLLVQHAQRLAELTGRRLHLRVTHQPYPIAQWAQTLHESAIDPLPGWEKYLEEEQVKVARLSLDTKVVYYGIHVGRLSGIGKQARKIFKAAAAREIEVLEKDMAEIDRTMASPGMSAQPATADQMDWLLTRSIGLGLPAPLDRPRQPGDRWMASDLAEHTEGIEWASSEPYGPHLQVQGIRNGRVEHRYVTVATLGRMSLPEIPESGYGPWLQRLDRLSCPYEVAATIDVRDAQEVDSEIRDQLNRIRAQVNHHYEHDADIPMSLARQKDHARHIEDEVQQGFSGLATRTKSWIRVAISHENPETLAELVTQLKTLYSPQITVVRAADQYSMAREFIPGEPLAHDGYVRRMAVTTLAGALPAATAMVGDKTGPNLGYTSGSSRRAVMWHPWRSTEVAEGSGLTPIVSTLGGGKSTLGGQIVYNTVRTGAPWVVLDPSGPLTRLCGLPELRPYSKAINLMNAEAGTLNPYRIVPDPRREHFDPASPDFHSEDNPREAAENAYHEAWQTTRAMRRTLAVDVLRGLLPTQITSSEHTTSALLRAAQRADTSTHSSPYEIIKELKAESSSLSEHAHNLADLLQGASELSQGQLIFPASQGGRDEYKTGHHRLVVLSLRGLTLPADGVPPTEWTLEEQYSMPLLYLAGWLAQRSIYERDMNDRKGLMLDECHSLLSVSSGRTLLRKTGRDSRKHNVRALYLTQDGEDILTAGISNWVDSVFVGRTIGDSAQRAALKLMNVEPGNGYENVLAGLSRRTRGSDKARNNREFIFSDGDGGIERITVTLNHRPGLRDALNSTAKPQPRKQAVENPYVGLSLEKNLAGETR